MYNYHAHAMALGGTLIHRHPTTIPPQASASLPSTGGSDSAHVENYKLDGPISFRLAQATVSGGPEIGKQYTYSTRVSVIIEGLNILNMVTADRIIAQLACEHDCNPKNSPKKEEPSITTIGSHFDNLMIAGHLVQIEMDHNTLSNLGTYGECAGAFNDPTKRQAVLDLMVGRGMPQQLPGTDPQHRVDIYNGYNGLVAAKANLGKTVLCSFVKKITGLDNNTGITTWGPVVVIPKFGTVYLGELMISHGTRHLTMLRFELGSPQGGSFGVGTGTGNGTGYP